MVSQTFSQLCSFDYASKTVQIYNAPWSIRDKPRFAYRGLLLGEPQFCYWKYYYHVVLFCEYAVVIDIIIILLCFTDTSRHYLPVDVIKLIIESMSYAKLVRKNL